MHKVVHKTPIIKACAFYETDDTHSDELNEINCDACITAMLQVSKEMMQKVYKNYCDIKNRSYELGFERVDNSEHVQP